MEDLKTVLIDITGKCNKNCKYCFDKDDELKDNRIERTRKKIEELNTDIQKIIFTGGEPFILGSGFEELLMYSKKKGFIVSVTTNGSYLTESLLNRLHPYIDEINLHVDSISPITNIKSGMFKSFIDEIDYYNIIHLIRRYKISINIHTVVHIFNQYENMQDFINYVKPGYWLVEDILNDPSNSIKAEGNNYQHFISKHIYTNLITEFKTTEKIIFY